MIQADRIRLFCETIWDWFAFHRRDLPWRNLEHLLPDDRAYRVLISEVMLQQTQVERVKVTYRTFLERFPMMEVLAAASNKEVLVAWRGMGYNSRALRLRDAVREIIGTCPPHPNSLPPHFAKATRGRRGEGTPPRRPTPNALFPSSMEDLISLPGIGHYTAAAVRNFAFDLPTPCLDTNIRRILHRTFVGSENADGTWKKDDAYLLSLAKRVLLVALDGSSRTASAWHAALMDYGSLVQKKTSPRWDLCWLTERSLMKATQESFPIKSASIPLTKKSQEPGRLIGPRFVPNRIIRGRIIEELRDTERGLPLFEIGKRVCLDWDEALHVPWLDSIIQKLIQDRLIQREGKKFVLAE